MKGDIVTEIGYFFWNITKSILEFFVFKIFKLDISDEKWNVFLQFVKFGIIGVSNTVVAYVINIACLIGFQAIHLFPRWDYMVANIISFILSVLWSFYWNNKYVFNLKNNNISELLYALLKMYLSYGFTGIVLSNVLSYVWVDLLHISKFIAPLINSIIGVPINFILNKFWAFKGN